MCSKADKSNTYFARENVASGFSFNHLASSSATNHPIQFLRAHTSTHSRRPLPKLSESLYYTFQYYKKTTTKKFLRHKVKHMCKRYFEYRRRCLTNVLSKTDAVYNDMERAILSGHYKPMTTCETVKECDKNQSPLIFTEIPAAEDLDDDDSTVEMEAATASTTTTRGL
uniref:Uncharacterized protein n=1 Tax=Ditylenchus dipsaci TaxID=166011 RepID=A0A915E1C4_9BILA